MDNEAGVAAARKVTIINSVFLGEAGYLSITWAFFYSNYDDVRKIQKISVFSSAIASFIGFKSARTNPWASVTAAWNWSSCKQNLNMRHLLWCKIIKRKDDIPVESPVKKLPHWALLSSLSANGVEKSARIADRRIVKPRLRYVTGFNRSIKWDDQYGSRYEDARDNRRPRDA